jgi:hypothetical protein
VIEIGTGSGYQAAILSQLVAEVYTFEIIEPLAKRAEADLRRLGFLNVKVLAGDGYKGWPEHAPFDSVIVTCAPDHIPQALIDQLRVGGRMIIPVGVPGDQQLYLLRKHGAKIEQQAVLPVFFVPMTRKSEAEDRPCKVVKRAFPPDWSIPLGAQTVNVELTTSAPVEAHLLTCVRWYLRFKRELIGIWPIWSELDVLRRPEHDPTCRSSRNVGKSTSSRSAIPGAWTRDLP